MTALSLVADLSYLDGLETVVVRQPGSDQAVTVSEALRRRMHAGGGSRSGTQEAGPSQGLVTQIDAKWLLATRQLAEEPQLGAKLVDSAGVEWTVLLTEKTALGSRWLLWCRALAIVHGLHQRITVQRAVWRKTAEGAQEPIWEDFRVGIAAKIQPLTLLAREQHQQRIVRGTHQIYVSESLPLDTTCRIVHGDSVYQVLGCRLLERIDVLLEIDVEQVPWPLGHASGSSP